MSVNTSGKQSFKKNNLTIQWRRQAPERISRIGGSKCRDITYHGNPEGEIPN